MSSEHGTKDYRVYLDEMVEGIQVISRDWKYLYLNHAAVLHSRKSREEMIGRTMEQVFPGIQKTDMFKRLDYVMHERLPYRTENEFEFPDGHSCWFELFIEPCTDGILIRSIDITDRKILEEQLRHSQRLEAVGRLAGGVAHDLNNKLGVILVLSERVARHATNDPLVKSCMERIIQAVGTATKVTKQLLAFSRKQVLDLKTINLNQMIEELRELLPTFVSRSIDLIVNLDPNLGTIRVDPIQMEQVIINLAINAGHAMSDGGTLTLETFNVDLDADYCKRHPDVTPGPYVQLTVSDTGSGMDKATLEQIFEPFFTTKGRNQGTGLGLAMVHGTVKQSKGHIWVYSELGKGTSFKLYFPRIDSPSFEEGTKPLPLNTPMGTEKILLVEDDPILNEAYATILESAGFKVTVAADFHGAVKCFLEAKGHFDLLLTDVVLANGNGAELAQQLRQMSPNLKVLFMSGYTENVIVKQGFIKPGTVLLQKPIGSAQLLGSVRMTLDGKIKQGVLS